MAGGNGGVLSAMGVGTSVVKLWDSTVADGTAAAGGAMEVKDATVDVERCTLTRLQARSSLATRVFRHHLSHLSLIFPTFQSRCRRLPLGWSCREAASLWPEVAS